MTRKDTILIAVVINAGLLAILFTTAVIYDTEVVIDQSEFIATTVEEKTGPDTRQTLVAANTTGDEVDHVLKYYTPPTAPIVVETAPQSFPLEPLFVPTRPFDEEETSIEVPHEKWVEVKVKKGDALEKIARAYKVSVESIKKFNHLKNENLSIGQVLKIPTKAASEESIAVTPSSPALTTKQDMRLEAKIEPKGMTAATANEPVYYTVKSGDSPWKIAKQFGVSSDDILRLNDLNEEKARNLKIGDRIRVK